MNRTTLAKEGYKLISKEGQNIILEKVAGNMADYFETQNPNFDRDEFIKACCT